MIKIIDGKRYNTETAENVADTDSIVGRGDFNWFKEVLYVTKKGSWFLHGKGGAFTRWREPAGGNCFGGGEDIEPMTADEARAWLEHYNHVDAIEAHFADSIEDA